MNLAKERLESVAIPARYNLKADELFELYSMAKEETPEALVLAFNYGFLRGQNYQKNTGTNK